MLKAILKVARPGTVQVPPGFYHILGGVGVHQPRGVQRHFWREIRMEESWQATWLILEDLRRPFWSLRDLLNQHLPSTLPGPQSTVLHRFRNINHFDVVETENGSVGLAENQVSSRG